MDKTLRRFIGLGWKQFRSFRTQPLFRMVAQLGDCRQDTLVLLDFHCYPPAPSRPLSRAFSSQPYSPSVYFSRITCFFAYTPMRGIPIAEVAVNSRDPLRIRIMDVHFFHLTLLCIYDKKRGQNISAPPHQTAILQTIEI